MARGTHCLAVSLRSYPQSRNWHAAAKSSLCRLPAEAPLARYSSVLGGRELLLVPTVYLGIGLIEKILDCVKQFLPPRRIRFPRSHCPPQVRGRNVHQQRPLVFAPGHLHEPPVRLGDNGGDIFRVITTLQRILDRAPLHPTGSQGIDQLCRGVVISPPCEEGLSASLNSLRSMSCSLNTIAATGICSLGCPPARSSALGS